MNIRPASLIEQQLLFDDVKVLAILHGSIYKHIEPAEWDEKPVLDMSLKKLKHAIPPSDLEPAADSAIPKYLRHEKGKMSLFGQECYTVLAELTEDRDVYSVPAQLAKLQKDEARIHRHLETRRYAWVIEREARTFILDMFFNGTVFRLVSYDKEDIRAYKEKEADIPLKSRLLEEAPSLRSRMAFLPTGYLVPKDDATEYAIRIWLEGKGADERYTWENVVLEYNNNNKAWYYVIDPDCMNDRYTLTSMENGKVTSVISFASLKDAQSRMAEEFFAVCDQDKCEYRNFGAYSLKDGNNYRWSIKVENDSKIPFS